MTSEPVASSANDARQAVQSAPPGAARRVHVLSVAFAVFVSGAVLLGLEITASRVLAPFFGNSLFVWGALIGVVLAGLAVGYWAGGALADRMPATRLLLAVMALGALLVLAVPLADEPVLEAIVGWDPGPRLNPLLAAIVLFGPPSVVFAAVTPIAVRLLAHSVARIGRTAGRLFAVSTAGSIVGTFATAFFLIPEFGTNQLLALAGAAMFVAVAVVAAVERVPVAFVAGAAAAVAAAVVSVGLAPQAGGTLSGAAAQNWSPVYRLRGDPGGFDLSAQAGRIRFTKETRYHSLWVVDEGDTRYLRFDSSLQSGMYIRRPFATRFDYTDYFHLALAYKRDARDILSIGLGGGSSQKRLWRDFPDVRLTTVELDPVVVDVAYRYFRLPHDRRLRVEVEDGRRYLADHDRRWDVINVDAYFSDSIPFHLTTHEFLRLARSRLRPGGVVLANVIGSVRGPDSKLFRSFYRTFRSIFPTVLVHPVVLPGETADSLRNIIILGTDAAAPSKSDLAARWAAIRARAPTAPSLRRAIATRYDAQIPIADVPTLTDDYAPTDALLFVG